MVTKEIIYDNPPLIEVIVEVKWELQKLEAIPGAAIDPHFPEFAKSFEKFVQDKGFKSVERVTPEDFPIEFLAGKPIFRYRKQKDKWPLFQIGPGLLTVNVVPPYGGWGRFKKIIHQGLEGLHVLYPISEKYLKISKLELRYLNGFDDEWGYKKYNSFLSNDLNCNIAVSKGIIDDYVESPDEAQSFFQFIFNLKKDKQSKGIIKVSPGSKKGKEAAILELTVQKNFEFKANEKTIIKWFDDSHQAISNWFQLMISDRILKNMGKFHEVGKEQ